MKKTNKQGTKKAKFNLYEWSYKNKKVFAGTICIMLVLGMLISLLQI